MAIDDQKILNWTINRIQTDYPNDVALLVGNGFQNEKNDRAEHYQGEIDYFISDSPRADGLSQSFIIGGVCYDIYPRTWSSIESMAALNDCHTACMADAKVLYARSKADQEKFEQFRTRLFDNLKNKAYTQKKAQERLKMAQEIYKNMLFETRMCAMRASIGFIMDYLAQSVALLNGRYFKRNELYQLEEMASFEKVPPHFAQMYDELIRRDEPETLRKLCYKLIVETSLFLQEQIPAPQQPHCVQSNYRALANWYQEFGHLWRRIEDDCRKGDARRVYIRCCKLQHELDVINVELSLPAVDLLSSFDEKSLDKVCKRAEEIEKNIIDMVVKNSICIAMYPTVDAFLENN